MTRQTMDGQEPIEERPIEPAQPVVENGECEEIGLLDPPAVDPSADSGGRKIGGIEIIDGRELMRRAGKRREDEIWLVDDWLPERSLFLMAGESHAGKSMVLLELAVSVASGRPFLGQHRVNQGPVLIVAAEDEPELVGERIDLAWRGKLESIPFPAQPNDGAFYYTAPVEPVGAPIWVAPGRAVGFGDPASEDTFAKVVGQLR